MTREEAIHILRTRIVPTRNWKEIWEALDMAIEALSADAEVKYSFIPMNDENLIEVVRCKDCRYAEHRKMMPHQVYCKRDMLSIYGTVHDDDDFCKYGEQLYTHEEVWGIGMTDRIKQCDIVDSCEECPRYGDDCDGRDDDE